MKQAIAAAATVVIAAGTNIAAGMVTQRWTVVWGLTLAVLIVLGIVLQWLTVTQSEVAGQDIQGGKVRGSLRQKMKGAGRQSISNIEVDKDLDQEQGL